MTVSLMVYYIFYDHTCIQPVASPLLPMASTFMTDQGRIIFKSSGFTTSGICTCIHTHVPCMYNVHNLDNTVICCLCVCVCVCVVGGDFKPFSVLSDSLHVFIDKYDPTSHHGVIKVHTMYTISLVPRPSVEERKARE